MASLLRIYTNTAGFSAILSIISEMSRIHRKHKVSMYDSIDHSNFNWKRIIKKSWCWPHPKIWQMHFEDICDGIDSFPQRFTS